MGSSDSRDRLVLLGIGLLVLLGPVVIIVLTLGALVLFGALAVGDVTFVELVELYLLELVLFVGFSYGVYRLSLWLIRNQLPGPSDSPDTRESTDPDADGRDTLRDAGDRSE